MGIFSTSKVIELSLARDYVRHWGLAEAVREILQNALDSDSPFEYEFSDDNGPSAGTTLTVRSRNATLSTQTLLLGKTSKDGVADKIGSFGEGYKIALLVLCREGYRVVVKNGDRLWRPEFRHSNSFGEEVLCIVDSPAPSKNEGLAFEIAGLTPSEVERVRQSCLPMQKDVGEVIETVYGRILKDRPGQLFVGGLFVCNTELEFGYDAKPEHLTLERDRQTVSTFDLQWLSKGMWFASGRHEEVARLMESGSPDLAQAQYGQPEVVKEACYRLFMEKHPGAVVAANQVDLNELVRRGMTEVVILDQPAYRDAVMSSAGYRAQVPPVVKKLPSEVLTDFFKAHRQHMRTPAIVAFKEILRECSGWVDGPKRDKNGDDLPF